jgi:hypothetical protein
MSRRISWFAAHTGKIRGDSKLQHRATPPRCGLKVGVGHN